MGTSTCWFLFVEENAEGNTKNKCCRPAYGHPSGARKEVKYGVVFCPLQKNEEEKPLKEEKRNREGVGGPKVIFSTNGLNTKGGNVPGKKVFSLQTGNKKTSS